MTTEADTQRSYCDQEQAQPHHWLIEDAIRKEDMEPGEFTGTLLGVCKKCGAERQFSTCFKRSSLNTVVSAKVMLAQISRAEQDAIKAAMKGE